MKIEIKQATSKHKYTLTVLTKKFFPYANFSFEEINRRLGNENIRYFVAEADGHVVGFADVEIVDKRCKFMGVAVLEAFRKIGIARKLVEKVIEYASEKKCEKVFLLVVEDNVTAIALYNSFGFISKGVTDKILDGKKIMLMEKLLATHLNSSLLISSE